MLYPSNFGIWYNRIQGIFNSHFNCDIFKISNDAGRHKQSRQIQKPSSCAICIK